MSTVELQAECSSLISLSTRIRTQLAEARSIAARLPFADARLDIVEAERAVSRVADGMRNNLPSIEPIDTGDAA